MKHRSLIIVLCGIVASLALGWIVFPMALYKSSTQPVQFSHRIHTGETVGLACSDCHAVTDDGRFSGIPALEKCSSCHAETIGSSGEEKRFVEEYVKPGREIPWLVYARQPENVYFSHAQHVKIANLPCERCHGPHGSSDSLRTYEENRISGYSRDIWGQNISGFRTTDWGGMKMDDCSRCHKERGVEESCLDCHK